MTTYKVEDHFLLASQDADPSAPYALVDLSMSPNHGGPFKDLRFLVIHYTAGASLKNTVAGFLDPTRKVSAHIVIGRDGNVRQMVAFDKVAWHAGESRWKSVKSLNFYSIGIELVNWGPLKATQDGRFWSWAGKEVPAAEVEEVNPQDPTSFGKRFWHQYPEKQIEAVSAVASALFARYDLQDVLGHSDIAPGRKIDPGPAFPLSHLRSTLQGRA